MLREDLKRAKFIKPVSIFIEQLE